MSNCNVIEITSVNDHRMYMSSVEIETRVEGETDSDSSDCERSSMDYFPGAKTNYLRHRHSTYKNDLTGLSLCHNSYLEHCSVVYTSKLQLNFARKCYGMQTLCILIISRDLSEKLQVPGLFLVLL